MTINRNRAEFRQGMVFNGVTSKFYPAVKCHGLVITADCDIIQEKTPVIHYLTIIALNDWVCKETCSLVASEYINEWLVKKGLDRSIITNIGTEALFPLFEQYESDSTKRKSLSNAVLLLRKECSKNKQKECDLTKNYKKLFKNKLQQLTSHRMTGVYFLENFSKQDTKKGFVVLLRDIQSIAYHDAKSISQSVEGEILNRFKKDYCFDISEEIIAPVATIKPPVLQHLMSSFSSTYTRIGLEDIVLEPYLLRNYSEDQK